MLTCVTYLTHILENKSLSSYIDELFIQPCEPIRSIACVLSSMLNFPNRLHLWFSVLACSAPCSPPYRPEKVSIHTQFQYKYMLFGISSKGGVQCKLIHFVLQMSQHENEIQTLHKLSLILKHQLPCFSWHSRINFNSDAFSSRNWGNLNILTCETNVSLSTAILVASTLVKEGIN